MQNDVATKIHLPFVGIYRLSRNALLVEVVAPATAMPRLISCWNSSIRQRMLNYLAYFFVTTLIQLVDLVVAKTITLHESIQACEVHKGTDSESRDCPEKANAEEFYKCITDTFSWNEWKGKVAVAMLMQLCRDLSAKRNHGLACTSTVFWNSRPCEVHAETIRFPIIGDWGGTEYLSSKLDHYAGLHDDEAEDTHTEFSRLLRRLNDKLNFDFIVNTGDNIYPNGIESASMRDAQFKAVFRDFRNLSPVWYSSFGNHDDYTVGSKEHEIEYTTHDPTGRWILPWSFYTFTYKLIDPNKSKPDTLVHFIVTDTVAICGHHMSGPRRMKRGSLELQLSNEHIEWLNAELSSEVAQSSDYLFVVGHYQPFSIRKKVDNWECMLRYFGPNKLADKYGVSAYFCGHQHLLQHFKKEGKKTKRRIDYVLSGEGSNIYPIHKADREDGRYPNDFYHGVNYPEQSHHDVKPGLIHVELRHDEATFHFVDADDKQLAKPITLPRRQKGAPPRDRTEL